MATESSKAKNMIFTQIISRGINDKKILSVMEKIPREKFVPKEFRDKAYFDCPLPIGANQTISQPYMTAVMTMLLSLTGTETVLEVGTGSGYQTAILASLARKVFTIERIPELSLHAREILDELGFTNIEYKIGDGTLGWKEYAPFDRILVAAASSILPPPLFEQLNESGLIIIPLGTHFMQELNIISRHNNKMHIQKKDSCVFVPLIGEYGY